MGDTLADLCEEIVDCPHSTPVWTDDGPIVLRSHNIRSGRLVLDALSYTDERHFGERTRRATPRAGDLVITREAPMGEVARIPEGLRCCLGQRMVLLRPNPAHVDSGFLLYALQSRAVQHQINAHEGTGSTVSNLRIHDLARLIIPAPPIAEQRRIAGILGALDDKIELNRRTSETLEAIARALFRSWFVDFDPVRAKTEDGDVALPPHLARLFPARLVDSELGKVPDGWRVARLGDEVATALGGTPARDEPRYWGGAIPWLNSGKANEFRVLQPSDWITQAGLERSATKRVPARTTLLAITGATLGQITITELEACINQSLVAVLGSDRFPTEYLYFWMMERMDNLLAGKTGAAQQHVNKNDVNRTLLLVPPREVLAAYRRYAQPLFDLIELLCGESLALSQARDAMLPRLLSGDLKAPLEATVLA